MSQFHFDPETYLDLIRAEVPLYDELQERVAGAAEGSDARRILDLGAGTGSTLLRLREQFPDAQLTALDESEDMLAVIDDGRVEKLVRRLQDRLPEGPFDLVVSTLAVHHLDPGEKRDLFRRVREILRSGGRFVLADVVTVAEPVAPLTPGYDKPDAALDQLEWLLASGFDARIAWEAQDVAVLVADRP